MSLLIFLTSIGKLLFQIGVPTITGLIGITILGKISDKKNWFNSDELIAPLAYVVIFVGCWVLSWWLIGQIDWIQGLR